ncbi:SAM-dependent methyltransferase [Hypericibacter adhaerens]|jgi:16S rRNA (cytosine967-C5)-methyltransferase|uniref:SAM-dependent methyltransferase n=1 Tax=Hypericibacter adhaerens TaxID=2602016 RepID=A0A5J6N7X8_9PROT|nr:transcription antitermination factor NusB [Hypericibacter adhaerens]QEX25205.1 SAM-dependent methyltransferase [Hypericibacter adhaerens]
MPPQQPKRRLAANDPVTIPRKATTPLRPARSSTRRIALELLHAVLRRHRPLDEAMADHANLARLEPRDRAFTRLMVATCLRRLGQIDAVLARCLERPLTPKASAAEGALRLGACQLLFLETPPHAAVTETIDALPRAAAPYHGLVNAVLRRIAQEGPALLRAVPEIPTNLPDWLWQGWKASYGEVTAAAIAAQHLREAPLDLTVKDPAEAALWAERLGAAILPNGSLRLKDAGAVETLPGFAEGAWWVQDAAASLPARLLRGIDGKRVIDLCAAPGGKTLQLAAAGARVTAIDRSADRMARVSQNLARTGLAATCIAADAFNWRPPELVDAVLLDAPCSATGTIRRHPDLPWIKKPAEMAELPALQRKLLNAAIAMTHPGGVIVYSVCSLEPAEGEDLIARAIDEGAPIERIRIGETPEEEASLGAPADALTRAGALRTLPCHWAEQGGMDGFYAVRLRRR